MHIVPIFLQYDFKTESVGCWKIPCFSYLWTIQYIGGQTIMDQGLENVATISLLTKENWIGNIFLTEKQKIGSSVRRISEGAITLLKLNDIRQAAEQASIMQQQKAELDELKVSAAGLMKEAVKLRKEYEDKAAILKNIMN